MRKIRFETPFFERAMAILLVMLGLMFIVLFQVGSVSSKAGDYFYSVKKFRFLFYSVCFLLPMFILFKNKILYSFKVTNEQIVFYYPIISFFLKLHPKKPKLRIHLPFNKITKVIMDNEEFKIYYIFDKEKEKYELISLLASGAIKDNDLQYIKEQLDLNRIEFKVENKTKYNRKKRLLGVVINFGLIFMIMLVGFLSLAYQN